MTLKQRRQHAASERNKALKARLPKGHPSYGSKHPDKTSKRLARRILKVLESSSLLPELNRRLRNHPGRQSRVSVKVLLLCVILAADDTSRYLRSDICSVMNGLNHRLGVQLGLWTFDSREPIGYTAVVKQLQRLEMALLETWHTSNGEVRSLDWFAHLMLSDTIHPEIRALITAASLDWTPIFAWGITRDFRVEAEVRAEQEPDDSGEIGTVDHEGRTVRSADRHARSGWATATNSTPAGPFSGYYGHLVTPVRSATWSGNPALIFLGSLPPMFVPYAKAVPANTDTALTGRNAILATLELFPGLKEVIADRGYTAYRENFVRPLHRLGINIVMDYTEYQRKTIELVEVGPEDKEQTLRLHCGTFFPEWLAEKWHVPPRDKSGKALEEWYNNRAKFRWTPIGKGKNGAIRFRCPQCDGRIMTSAKTWRYRHRRTKPNPDIPNIGAIDTEYCCGGTVTIPVEKLDTYQLIPYGTTAWKKSYSRRNRIENVNGMIKDKGGLKRGWCRAFGLAAHNLGLVALVVAHNLQQAMKHEDSRPSAESNGHEPQSPTTTATPPSARSRNGMTIRGPPD
ncbi:MAG: transposase [bacterium]|nr:transposase [bacterium]MDE0600414.1 transposase [bacterium]